jgi:hypothetical protein
MAKFLDTQGVSYFLAQLIKEANEKLLLISPYLKLSDRMYELLEDKDKLKLAVHVIYGKNELHPDEASKLRGLRSVRLLFCKNLHAKCYLSERAAIITSMNLYEFSQVNNNEMGIYVTSTDDPQLYKDISDEAQRLLRTSDDVEVSIQRVTRSEPVKEEPQAERNRTRAPRPVPEPEPENGVCIRCQTSIPLKPLAPYCRDCYGDWSRRKDDSKRERYCHLCAKEHASSKAKPVCYPCYKANKDVLAFVTDDDNIPF